MAPAHPPDPTLPDEKALGAMAKASRRAQESTSQESTESDGRAEPNPEIQAAYLAATRAQARRRNERIIVALSVLVGVLVLAAATTLVTVVVFHHIGSSPGPSASGRGSSRGNSSSTTTSSSIPTVVPGGPPVVMSLQPATGTAGQVITVQGANFVSSDGHVAAEFGGVETQTDCPSATTCSATVPPQPPGSSKVPVTITTASGTSNPVDFTYQ